MSFIRQHKGAVVWSLLLHIVVGVGAAIGLPWLPERPRIAVAMAPIQGVIIDPAVMQRQQTQRDEAARKERQRQQLEERQRREAADQQRLADEREQDRAAAERRARDEASRKEQERLAAEKREQDQREQQRREQQANEQREKEAAARREREAAAAQRRREEELALSLAAEAERGQAEAAGLLDQYIRLIQSRIEQNWDRPLSAGPGIDCVVNVVQLPTGDVVSAQVASCNGDDAVRRSIERAVLDASPLPKAPTPALFERSLIVNFRPDE